MIYLEIITSIILVVIMGYMSAIETAYLAINEKKIELGMVKNPKRLKKLKVILREPKLFYFFNEIRS